MDKYIDVPMATASQSDVVAKTYTSSASVTHKYTGDMVWTEAQMNRQPPTSDANKIN